MLTQQLLDRIADTLYEDASNYHVFLKVYRVANVASADALSAIRKALGTQAQLEAADGVHAEEAWTEIESALLHAGSDGAGPSNAALGSAALAVMLAELKGEVFALANRATRIERFALREGHPAYPVFWDFAFLFREDGKAVVFIGSSSD